MKKAILQTTLKIGSEKFLEKGSIFEEPFSKEVEMEIKKRPELFKIIDVPEVAKKEGKPKEQTKIAVKKK